MSKMITFHFFFFLQGYQFWTQTNKQGYFLIKDVRPGNYSLYATVPGFIGDYKYEANIIIEPGKLSMHIFHCLKLERKERTNICTLKTKFNITEF